MIFTRFTIGYIFISAVLYLLMSIKCKANPVFKAPRNAAVFYILSFTWGLPSVLIGLLAALVLRIIGNKPKKYGWAWCFELENIHWGLELGIFFIAPKGNDAPLKMHEHGHSIQNIYLGIFNPLVVSVPSLIRFWYREIRKALGQPCQTGYDDIWFEQSASQSGKALLLRLENSEKQSHT